MTFPATFTVAVHTYSDGTPDGYNVAEPTYTPDLNSSGTSRDVYGWSIPSTTEPKIAGHDRVVVDVELLAPPEFPAGPHDVIDIPTGPNQGRYEVVGELQDMTQGPFLFTPGVVINLKRVEG